MITESSDIVNVTIGFFICFSFLISIKSHRCKHLCDFMDRVFRPFIIYILSYLSLFLYKNMRPVLKNIVFKAYMTKLFYNLNLHCIGVSCRSSVSLLRYDTCSNDYQISRLEIFFFLKNIYR